MKKIGKNILIFILGGLIFSVVSVYAAVTISANNITLSSSKTTKTNVKDALDELYNNVGKCPSGKECYAAGTLATAQAACPSGKECYATGTLAASTTVYYAYGNYTISTFPKANTSPPNAYAYGKLIGNQLFGCYNLNKKESCVSLNDANNIGQFCSGLIFSVISASRSLHTIYDTNQLFNTLNGCNYGYDGYEVYASGYSVTYINRSKAKCVFTFSNTTPTINCDYNYNIF